MKKFFSIILIIILAFALPACGRESLGGEMAGGGSVRSGVELNVVTTFAGKDSNAQNFNHFYKEWEEATGNKVIDMSAVSDDTFKSRVLADFETSSEPDVLFFFTGGDADTFIEAGKVVSIKEIREIYPDYAFNMDEALLPDSLVNGEKYAVPVNGYWEALFVNTEILEEAGVSIPGSNYTWEQFLNDCQSIKEAGYIPIAAALGHIPHYWWEYSVFNHTSPDTHLKVPESIEDPQGGAWIAGLEDIKAVYEAGYFPPNTLAATDDETFAMFIDGKAAFLLDGSWKVGTIVAACRQDIDDEIILNEDKLDKFDITFVPAQGERKASDLIGGISMGYYITKKAWDDPEKRDAAVDFVMHMTTDEVIRTFAKHTAVTLKNEPEVDISGYNSLEMKAMCMITKCTSLTSAVQDLYSGLCREPIFDGLPEIVTGNVEAHDAVREGLDIYYSR